LRLERSIALPGVEGRIDHLAADVAGARLFVAALGNQTIEVIDLPGGKVAGRIGGLGEPQGLAYVPELARLFAADGADGAFRIYDGHTLKLLETVKLGGDADNVRYDATRKQVWVGYGDGALAVLDAATGKRLGEVKLDGHPESFQLEPSGTRIFVNVPNAGHVAVIDRVEQRILGKSPLPGAAANFPMALDSDGRRLFIGCRKPPEVVVLSWAGKRTESQPIHGDTDDLFWDAKRSRLYVSCGEGFLDVLEGAKRVSIATAAGARTSLYVPQLDRLFLAVPHRGAQRAEIRVYRPE
jgi:hypothetical protein